MFGTDLNPAMVTWAVFFLLLLALVLVAVGLMVAMGLRDAERRRLQGKQETPGFAARLRHALVRRRLRRAGLTPDDLRVASLPFDDKDHEVTAA